ncbi:MAG: YqeG family HAD IIIA-type phosphatase [Oscillospiraceae bacterium]|nr:YqeG family HAD IIIA-type phosphatase [Oscillospiraceae bacterium]MDD4368348.1 YqeG family HAD IIIA-type phosphatase [Oscillospiraceae bacterium]
MCVSLGRPDAYYSSIYTISWPALRQKGYRLILLDIDNTLMPHGRHEATPAVRQLLSDLKAAGLVPVILSNAQTKRAATVGNPLQVLTVGNAGKPGTRGIRQACRETGLTAAQAVLIGDQLFTDMLAGWRGGCRTILVRRLSATEPWYIHLKRLLELPWRWFCVGGSCYDHLPAVTEPESGLG